MVMAATSIIALLAGHEGAGVLGQAEIAVDRVERLEQEHAGA